MQRSQEAVDASPRSQTKKCTKCKCAKPVTSFALRTLSSGRMAPRGDCKSCRARAKRVRRHKTSVRPKGRKANVVLFSSPELQSLTPFGRWLNKKLVQKRAGVDATKPCSLTREWVLRHQHQTHCPVTGLPFVLHSRSSDGSRHMLNPSLDRVNSSGAYTDDNVRIISLWANLSKNSLSDGEFKYMLRCTADNLKNGW
jgi:hypothetical protein